MRKTIETILDNAGRNHYGYYDVSPGTDMARRLNCSESAIKTMIRRGYLKKVGSGLVLTNAGYGA